MRKKIIRVQASLMVMCLVLMPAIGWATEGEDYEQPPGLTEEIWMEENSFEQPSDTIGGAWTEENWEQVYVPEPTPETAQEPTLVSLFEIDGDVLKKYNALGENKSVTIPDGVRVIGREVFRGDHVLEVVTLPDSVEEIQERAFADCTRLREIRKTSGSSLRAIWDQAFLNCRNLDISFAVSVQMIAGNAFEGAIVDLPAPAATEIQAPIETPIPPDISESTSDPAPEKPETPTPPKESTQIPESPENPSQEVISESDEDPYEEIEWEDTTPVQPSSGGSGKKRQSHSRSSATTTEMHDYDQVRIDLNGQTESQPMHTLTLDGEELELTLDSAEGESRSFTCSLYDWTDAKAAENAVGDTLILRAAEDDTTGAEEELCWRINGAALRKLSKSGIAYLVFQQGENLTAIPTDGFLAGWAYDEMKSRGTAGRRFDYTLSTGEAPQWIVEVEGTRYELGEDPLASIYLTGVENGTEDMLKTAKEE